MEKTKIKKIRKSILRSSELLNNGTVKPLDKITVTKTNCYAYSLGIMYHAEEDDFLIGFTEDALKDYTNPEKVIEKICRDLKNLKIPFRKISLEDDKTLKEGEYLVKVFYALSNEDYDGGDFHFIRQDRRTKRWFHKMGWCGQPEFVRDDDDTSFEFESNGEPRSFRLKEWFNEEPLFYKPLMYLAIKEQ